MPLISLWQSNPATIAAFSIEQIVKIAGGGDLKDNSECSAELRAFLAQVPTDSLASYLDHCLTQPFTKSGLVLQDIVNELGRRLDYEVKHGLYQGTVNAIGYDGIWAAPEGGRLIIEVKTTDAYRISLDKLAEYRCKLIESGMVTVNSSILIVTGRTDTGELEAQVRGSRHAWDMRLISVDALLKAVQIKQNTTVPDTAEKIRRLLIPVEFTRLDGLIDVIFETAKDVETAARSETIGLQDGNDEDTPENELSGWTFTSPADLDAKRVTLVDALADKLGTKLVKHSRALFEDSAHDIRVAVTISKRYTKRGQTPYWYAYHPQWDKFLGEAKFGFLVLGCMDQVHGYALPLDVVRVNLPNMNTTTTPEGRQYWHVKIIEDGDGVLQLQLPKASGGLSLNEFVLKPCKVTAVP